MTDPIVLPPEPEGPVWDKDGERWDKAPAHGLWCGPDAKKRHWGDMLWFHGPLTSTPPWKPEVGGIVETLDQFRALPEGSIIAVDHGVPAVRNANPDVSGCMVYPRTILRVGWES